jgi:sulfur relay (sulfurtransferase) complex TusBCD TusD component (DsrE family)
MPSPLAGKKLGILVSAAPTQPNFRHGLAFARTALENHVTVYLYLIDEAVIGVDNTQLQTLRTAGLKLFACAYGAKQRNLETDDRATWAGLATASEIISATDRFVSFN